VEEKLVRSVSLSLPLRAVLLIAGVTLNVQVPNVRDPLNGWVDLNEWVLHYRHPCCVAHTSGRRQDDFPAGGPNRQNLGSAAVAEEHAYISARRQDRLSVEVALNVQVALLEPLNCLLQGAVESVPLGYVDAGQNMCC
jgi:hypothetical protein